MVEAVAMWVARAALGVPTTTASASTISAPRGVPGFYPVRNPLPSTKAGTLIKSQMISSGMLS
jgi:hypothetical protein